MSETEPKKVDAEKGDEVLKRMLKTPPVKKGDEKNEKTEPRIDPDNSSKRA